MKQIQADLYETEAEMPFSGVYTHAYLLLRDDGNVLFYNTSRVEEFEHMERLGGVARQYLSHCDELSPSLKAIGERFGAELGGHFSELEQYLPFRRPTILFTQQETHLSHIEVIPTPGHSPGSTCFYVQPPHGKRYLFSGDTLYFNKNRVLATAFFPARGNLESYVKSLETLRELNPDVVISSASGGAGGYDDIRQGEWPERVNRALKGLLEKASESGLSY